MTISFLVDDFSGVRSLMRRNKIAIDPMYAGECRRLAGDTRILKQYFSNRRGLSIDGIGELLWDQGYTYERPTCNEVLDLLEWVL